jgi:hypothetical protein
MGSIAHQFAVKAETTYGTAVTVDRFLEFVTESLHREQNVAGSEGIRPGTRLGRGSTRRITRNWAEGTVNFEVATTKHGVFFEHLLGTVSSATVSTSTWVHTFSSASLLGKGLTLQKGVEKVDGTVQAFTYAGAKIRGINFSIDEDAILNMEVDFLARQEVTSTSLATGSYTAPTVFHYAQGTVLKDDVALANIRRFDLNIQNNLVQRFNMGNSGLSAEPINRPMDTVSGTLELEFNNLTDFHTAFATDASLDLDFKFETTGEVIEGTWTSLLTIALDDARFEGDTPQVDDLDIVVVSVPFTAWDPTSGSGVTIVYRTADTGP